MNIQPGDDVYHPRFGDGIVKQILDDDEAIVFFHIAGDEATVSRKKLILETEA